MMKHQRANESLRVGKRRKNYRKENPLGVKKFAYDIWGDTVNIASRMETISEEGKINISQSTFELVKDKFICSHRGKIQVKNKGEIDMYFVEERS